MRGQKRIPSDQSEANSSHSNIIIKVLQLAKIEGLIKLSLRQMGCFLDYKMWDVSVLFPSMPLFCVVLLLLVLGEKSLYNTTFCLITFLFWLISSDVVVDSLSGLYFHIWHQQQHDTLLPIYYSILILIQIHKYPVSMIRLDMYLIIKGCMMCVCVWLGVHLIRTNC